MKYLGITQARVSSTRLPGKIFKEVNGITMLEMHLRRILKSKKIDQLVVAIADEPNNELIVQIAKKCGCEVVIGSLENVLARFMIAATEFKSENVIRFTSDCPLIDSDIIDQTIEQFEKDGADYTSNCLTSTWPDGMDCEVFNMKALEASFQNANLKSETEHVTLYIRNHPELFKITEYIQNNNWGKYRMTLDTTNDFVVIERLIQIAGANANCAQYINVLEQHPEIFKLNSEIIRNEGLIKSLKEDQNVK